jgi:hypothetical protein
MAMDTMNDWNWGDCALDRPIMSINRRIKKEGEQKDFGAYLCFILDQ